MGDHSKGDGQQARDTYADKVKKSPTGDYALRGIDWNAAVLNHGELQSYINKGTNVGVMILPTKDEIDVVAELLLGAGWDRCAFTLIYLHRDGDTRVPVERAGHLSLLNTTTKQVIKGGTMAPTLKRTTTAEPDKLKAAAAASLIVHIVWDCRYTTQEQYNIATTRPRDALRNWASSNMDQDTRKCIQDVWSFREMASGARNRAVSCLARTAEAGITKVLNASGIDGVFIEPLSWPTTLMRTHPNWTAHGGEPEALAAAIAEAANEPASLGLIRGQSQIGIRMCSRESDTIELRWTVVVPKDWNDKQVCLALADTELCGQSIVGRKTTEKNEIWTVKATTSPALDVVRATIDEEVWARRAQPPERAAPPDRALRAAATYGLDDVEKLQTSDDPARGAEKSGSGDANGPGPGGAHDEPTQPKYQVKEEEGKDTPDPKRRGISTRARVPPCAIYKAKGDGNCFYHAAQRYFESEGRPKPLGAQRLRAEVVQHMRRHQESYKPDWDQHDSKGRCLDHFDGYLNEQRNDGVYAGLLKIKGLVVIKILPQGELTTKCTKCGGAEPWQPAADHDIGEEAASIGTRCTRSGQWHQVGHNHSHDATLRRPSMSMGSAKMRRKKTATAGAQKTASPTTTSTRTRSRMAPRSRWTSRRPSGAPTSQHHVSISSANSSAIFAFGRR